VSEIKERMTVVGKDGTTIGTVDRVEGDRIKLTKSGSAVQDGQHHYIDTQYVGSVEGEIVKLSLNAAAIPKA
jgi:hypothetical protein